MEDYSNLVYEDNCLSFEELRELEDLEKSYNNCLFTFDCDFCIYRDECYFV